MKQHITVEQLDELSKKALKKLSDYASSKGYLITDFSIGQMIEFLNEHFVSISRSEKTNDYIVHFRQPGFDYLRTAVEKEPCDALWEATKQILEK